MIYKRLSQAEIKFITKLIEIPTKLLSQQFIHAPEYASLKLLTLRKSTKKKKRE